MDTSEITHPPAQSPVHTAQCSALFAFDVGLAIDLDAAARAFSARGPANARADRPSIKRSRRTPEHLDYGPAPLRITLDITPIVLGAFRTTPQAELTVFDFGAVSVEYVIPLPNALPDAAAFAAARDLADVLYENDDLRNAARRLVDELITLGGPAIRDPGVAPHVEDYHIFAFPALPTDHPAPPGAAGAERTLHDHRRVLAQILRAETRELSLQETDDALSHRLSYADDDLVLVDWNAAIIFDEDPADTLAILEFTNVELLQMRCLDDRLDASLADAYTSVSRPPGLVTLFSGSASRRARHIAAMQLDAAMLFESVNNALKLVGDQYLARLYRLAAGRLHLPDWDASILRKLHTLETMYQKLSDDHAARRMEVLEWIIIILIAVSTILPFVIASQSK